MSHEDGKKVEIIPLARKKMAQRGIPESWVEETLVAPEQIVEGYGGRKVAHKRVAMEGKERLLRVVFEETESTLVVVTAYLTSDIARYWRAHHEARVRSGTRPAEPGVFVRCSD